MSKKVSEKTKNLKALLEKYPNKNAKQIQELMAKKYGQSVTTSYVYHLRTAERVKNEASDEEVKKLLEGPEEWQTFNVMPKEMQQVMRVAEQLKKEEGRRKELEGMTELQRAAAFAEVVQTVGVKKMREILLYLEFLNGAAYTTVDFVERLLEKGN